mgnify:CR=1 FL=1
MNTFTKNFLRLITLTMLAVFIASPAVGFAPSRHPSNPALPTYTALSPLPCIQGNNNASACPGGNGSLQEQVNFKDYVQYIFNLAIFLAAGAAVFMIVWGGFEYTTSASFQTKSAGLDKVKNALTGLILVLTSYLILRTIDPRLVAIPTTLVAPLNIKYQSSTNSFADSLTQLQNAQDQYKVNLTNFTNNVQQAKAAIDDSTAKQNTLYDKIVIAVGMGGSDSNSLEVQGAGGGISHDAIDKLCGDVNVGGGDPTLELNSLCSQLQQTKDTIAVAQGVVGLNTAEGAMLAGNQQCAFGDSACLEKNNTSTTAILNQYSSQLQPDQKAVLNAYQVYSGSLLDLSKQYSDPTATVQSLNAQLAAMTTAVKTYTSLPNPDPVAAAQMQTQLQAATVVVQDRIKVLTKYGPGTTPCMNMGGCQ